MLLSRSGPVAAAHEKKTFLGFPSYDFLFLLSAPLPRYINFQKDTESFTSACCRSVQKHVHHKKCAGPLLYSISASGNEMRVEEVWISTTVHVLCADVSDTKLQVAEMDLEMNLQNHINRELGTRNWFVSQTFTSSHGDAAIEIITTWASPPALALAR